MSKRKATSDIDPDAQDEIPASSRLKYRAFNYNSPSTVVRSPETSTPEWKGGFSPTARHTICSESLNISAPNLNSNSPLQSYTSLQSSTPRTATSAGIMLEGNLEKQCTAPGNKNAPKSEARKTAGVVDPKTLRSQHFMKDMAELNRSFASWITSCIKDDPTAILTQVFIDHQRQAQVLFNEERARTVGLDRLLVLRAQEKVLQGLRETADDCSLSDKSSDSQSETPLINGTVTEGGAFSAIPILPVISALNTITPKDTFNPFLNNNAINGIQISPVANVIDKTSMNMRLGPKTSETVAEKTTNFTGHSFASACNEAAIKAAAAKETEQTDEDTPPKVEFTPVQEEGAVYTKRCKIFFKKEKGEGFEDRGIGTLFVKPVPSTNRHQLIVRSETSLGNLLVNALLSPNIPVQKMGDKNVMLVLVPTPGSAVRVVYIRLKEGADEVVQMLTKFSKI